MLNCIGIVLYCPNIWKCCIDIVQLTKMLYSSGLATTPSLLLQFQPHGSNPFLGAKISPQYSNSSQAQVIGSFGVALRLSFEHQSRALGLGSGIQQKVWPFLEEFDRILVFRLGGGRRRRGRRNFPKCESTGHGPWVPQGPLPKRRNTAKYTNKHCFLTEDLRQE